MVQKVQAKVVRAMTIMQAAIAVPPPTVRTPHAAMAVAAIRVHQPGITVRRKQARVAFVVR